jgi:hypothetical protein
MTSRRRKSLLASSLALIALAYLSGPIIAGIFGIGNRAGPKIYPQGLHELLYIIAWESSSHDEGKPRLPAAFRAEYRPWFYGQYSKNDDPVWLEAEYRRLRQRLDAQRAAE